MKAIRTVLLSLLLFLAHGCNQQPVSPIAALRAAAEKGDPVAQYKLASSYAHGKGVGRDEAEAVRWYRKAAESGYARSQYRLATMYATGEGVKTDMETAATWYRRAADQAVGNAQFRLGMLYASGKGVTKDVVAAYQWLALSKANTPESSNQLRSLEKEMTPGQIGDAQRAADQWRTTHPRK